MKISGQAAPPTSAPVLVNQVHHYQTTQHQVIVYPSPRKSESSHFGAEPTTFLQNLGPPQPARPRNRPDQEAHVPRAAPQFTADHPVTAPSHHGSMLTSCGTIYIVLGILGVILWATEVGSRGISMLPLGAPIGGVLGGAMAILATKARDPNSPACSRCLFCIALLLFCFLLLACVMDTVAYFMVYSRMDQEDPAAPMAAAAGSMNLLAAVFSLFVVAWLSDELRRKNPTGSVLRSEYSAVRGSSTLRSDYGV